VDTNVMMTANGANAGAPLACVAASAKALHAVMEDGHAFVDDEGRIVAEYRANLRGRREPGPGDLFFRWLLTHEWGGEKVTRVHITAIAGAEEGFEELPPPEDGTVYDPSDRKFLAVAAAHGERPPLLQSFDSKWWGWQEALAKVGVTIHFRCPDDIAKKHAEKMRR
jgi:hypothetical protein